MSDEQASSAIPKDDTTLICTRCRQYLTVLPIMTWGDETICGRCYHPEEFTGENRPQRNFTYETLSVLYAFPCKHRAYGCTERNGGEARIIHEDICLYRPMKCFIPNCEWSETVGKLQSHFEQTHPDLFEQSGFFVINTDSDYEVSTLHFDKQVLYILQIRFDKTLGKFWVSVVHIRTAQYHNIEGLELEFNSGRTCFLHDTSFAEEFKPIDTESALEFDVMSFKSLLGNPVKLTGLLKLLIPISAGLINMDVLNELECRVCRDYMVPPIFVCSNGHSICEECGERVATCPTCRGPHGIMRNTGLESIIKLLYYPCKYKGNNCSFVASSLEIRAHEDDCTYKI